MTAMYDHPPAPFIRITRVLRNPRTMTPAKDGLVTAFCDALRQVGADLAAHYPPGYTGPIVYIDRVIEVPRRRRTAR